MAYTTFIVDQARKAGISVILVGQTLYSPGIDFLRIFVKASTGVALWPFQSDQLSVSRFASQIYGEQRQLFLRAYRHVCDRLPRGSYLYVHLRHESGKPVRSLRNFLTVPLSGSAGQGPVFDPSCAFVYELSDEGSGGTFVEGFQDPDGSVDGEEGDGGEKLLGAREGEGADDHDTDVAD